MQSFSTKSGLKLSKNESHKEILNDWVEMRSNLKYENYFCYKTSTIQYNAVAFLLSEKNGAQMK